MVKVALALLETALVQVAQLQAKTNESLAEALLEALVETLPEAELEALVEPLEETLLEALDQALLYPLGRALVQRERGTLQAQVLLALPPPTADLAQATPDKG